MARSLSWSSLILPNLLLVQLGLGCIAPQSDDGAAKVDDTCKHVPASVAASRGGTGEDVTIDGTTLRFCDSLSASAHDAEGVRTIAIVGAYGHQPGVADDGAGVRVAIALDLSKLGGALGKPLAIAGETTFTPEAAHSYSIKSARFTPAPSGSPIVRDAAVTYGCFCTLYGPQSQQLTGTVTIEASDSTHVKGRVHLDVDGSIPFWNNGFAKKSKTVVDAVFDAPLGG